MLLSAVSLGCVLLSGPQQLQKKEAVAWEGVKTSVAFLLRGGIAVGEAALIDKSGLFLANQSAVSTPTLKARLSDGRIITLTWKATDVPTQTVLLQADEWDPEMGSVVALDSPQVKMERKSVVVVLPSGPVPGVLVSNDRVGVLGPSRRMFPLSEIRFEASAQSVAGALVFDEEGHLLGLINATLEPEQNQSKRVRVPAPHGGADAVAILGGNSQTGNQGLQQGFATGKSTFGPADSTTGYTVGIPVLQRVITGFLSSNHKVLHPAIGVFCKDAPSLGALVQQVKADSPAEKAGIQANDVIVKMDGQEIRNQFDFARVIESKESGESLTITVLRNSMERTFKLTVGSIQKALKVPGDAGPTTAG